MIPAQAVEAAAKIWQARDRSEGFGEYELREYAEDVTAMLAAAAPHMLAGAKIEAWDEGRAVGIDECAGDLHGAINPYRPTP